MNRLLIGGWAYSPALLHDTWHQHGARVVSFNDPVPGDADLVIGWSLGGLRALQAIASGQLQTAGLVLVSSTARFCRTEGYDAGADRAALRAMMAGIRRNREATLTTFYRDCAFPQALDDQELNRRLRAADTLDNDPLLAGLRELDTIDLLAALDSIALPVLILHGALDRIIPVDASRILSGKLDRAERHVHASAGHEMILHQASWVQDHIERFAAAL